MTLTLITGLLAGAGHALSGPDHLAAVVPLAMGKSRAAALSGLSWGLGHGLGLLISGALVLAGRAAFGADVLSGLAESMVGVLLIATGGVVLIGVRRPDAHPHIEGHHRHLAAAGIGVVHGAAGMAHVMVLVAAATLPLAEAAAWLVAFTLGAGAAIGAAAWLIQRFYQGAPPQRATQLRTAGGALTLLVGVVWLIAAQTGGL